MTVSCRLTTTTVCNQASSGTTRVLRSCHSPSAAVARPPPCPHGGPEPIANLDGFLCSFSLPRLTQLGAVPTNKKGRSGGSCKSENCPRVALYPPSPPCSLHTGLDWPRPPQGWVGVVAGLGASPQEVFQELKSTYSSLLYSSAHEGLSFQGKGYRRRWLVYIFT